MGLLNNKKFDLKSAIDYLEFWKPVDGPAQIMILWSKMGTERIHQAIVKLGYDLSTINADVAMGIIKKAFGEKDLPRTHQILLDMFRQESNPGKWVWMMDWCRRQGFSPTVGWPFAEKAYGESLRNNHG